MDSLQLNVSDSVVSLVVVYIRVSSSQQDLERQNQIYTDAITAGYYVAGVYKEKASGARADRPELLLLLLIQ
ncbi:recombinase family protein [Vibrio fluvialis]|nr:hypothetical protein [Vibrio cholerae]MCE7651979.1 recombinase family protein [Vibrio fluvialis]